MQTSNIHIINTFFLEVNTPSKQKGYYLKDHINTFLKEELFPLLETYFDALDKKIQSKSIQIESVDMDISIHQDLDFNAMKLEILDQFQKQIGKQIETDFADAENYTVLNKKEKDENEFFNFLEYGKNAWWKNTQDRSENKEMQFEKLINEESFGSKLISALKNEQSRNRFIRQLSNNQIYNILQKTFVLELSDEKVFKTIQKIKENQIISGSTKLELQQRNFIWEIIFLQLLKQNQHKIKSKLVSLINSFAPITKYKSEFVLETLTSHIENKLVFDVLRNLENEVLNLVIILEQKASEKLQKKNNLSEEQFQKKGESSVSNEVKKSIFNTKEEQENRNVAFLLNEEIVAETDGDYYANNAGLILIHPFLKQLFENCKLLHKDNSINDPETAAHLLHFIATSKEQDYEDEMLFEKFLCNIPINQTINRNIMLSEELKNQANEMLEAVLENWSIMKNSSVALLQNEYLQRAGKIILTTENPKILVERKTQDILLDKISWNLGIVKLAWKNKIIFVEW